MMGINKKIIAPIVAVLAMAVQLICGVEIDEAVQSQIVDVVLNVILVCVTLYGIFKNYHDKPKEQ